MPNKKGASNDSWGWLGNTTFGGVLLLGLCGPLLWLYLTQEASTTARSDCINGNGPRSTFEGIIRRAGSAMFIQGSTWRWVSNACGGKHERACLKQDHGPAVLAANIGKPITAEFCGSEVISYTVAGRRFEH